MTHRCPRLRSLLAPIRRQVAAPALGLCLSLAALAPTARAGDALDRLHADASADGGVVVCLLPGQVRRLGAFATTVSARRVAHVSPATCRAGGGEYVEPTQDPQAALKIWLPLAADGIDEAQVTAGEIYDRGGKPALAKAWYEKAAARGNARATVNLASLYARGLGVAQDLAKAQALIYQVVGLPVPVSHATSPRIELVDPSAALQLPPAAGSREVTLPPATAGEVPVTGRATASAGIARLTVNGQPRAVDAQGLFTLPVSADAATSTLDVTATDTAGASTTAQFTFRKSAAATTTASTAPVLVPEDLPRGKRYALVLANQDYVHWPKLDTPVADGEAIAERLRQQFGFEVQLVTNATRQSMLAGLSALRQKAAPEDQVVVYYAGHGQMDEVTARGYWIPVDADTKDLANWVSVIDVTDQLAAMAARHVLVIADSCYSGTLAGSLMPQIDAALDAQQRQHHLSLIGKQRARVALTSGGLEPVVDGGGGTHSLFARSLLDVLAQVHGPLAAQEVSTAVEARFAHLARRLQLPQQPHYAPIAFAGHEAGDFVLVPR